MLLPPAREKAELLEVVRITDLARHIRSADLTGDVTAIWNAAQAEQTLALIGELPESELHRCFFPGWGVRAHSSTDLLFKIAFCFRCHGARLWGAAVSHGQDGIHSFDPDSPAAVELLRRFRDSASGRE